MKKLVNFFIEEELDEALSRAIREGRIPYPSKSEFFRDVVRRALAAAGYKVANDKKRFLDKVFMGWFT